ncbi:hypothetical protein BMR1_02g02820 [Babesia microti strain RI]|uniref:Uncharacterized protein n=1 Tax=Babesia microti (strain RI) TaxID=1133968 RepID=I7I8U9_BABMR|nr:hypothetical protein BMR1_02g02820 [Babesia microti strain RI]CCF73718.1 hypothetical protein BMR1_02g02820 [Babesia microti strain RI]|eukprot:XP_012648327.1 hypothetical protein BMR1_02g02820 [Babesia microti strain RI]
MFKYFRQTCALLKRIDKRTQILSIGAANLIILTILMISGTLIVDTQFEARYNRCISIGKREQTLQEEHNQLMLFLSKTDSPENLDNSVPIPKIDL